MTGFRFSELSQRQIGRGSAQEPEHLYVRVELNPEEGISARYYLDHVREALPKGTPHEGNLYIGIETVLNSNRNTGPALWERVDKSHPFWPDLLKKLSGKHR